MPFAKLRSQRGLYDGRETAANWHLMQACTHHWTARPDLGVTVIFTRDVGHHSSGWWKNPDYERCFHLSLSCVDLPVGAPRDFDRAIGGAAARAFFADNARLCWIEGPYSPEGKARDVWHYRLFCDADWSPILPRGEVYSRENTPPDFKSFTEIHGDMEQDQAPFLLASSA